MTCMQRFGAVLLRSAIFGSVWGAALLAQDKPIPNPEALRHRAIATEERTADQREKYECRERQVQNDLDGKGRVKKSTITEQDFFFVKGRPIFREVVRDGKPLSPGDQKKQDERVRKEILSAEKAASKDRGEGSPFSSKNFLRLAKLVNERRVIVAGRPTIVFDVVDDPNRKTDTIIEKIVTAMRGTISVDEETGHVQDLNVNGARDVKIGGGLLANVHKGFLMHAVVAPQNDGVWMMKTM